MGILGLDNKLLAQVSQEQLRLICVTSPCSRNRFDIKQHMKTLPDRSVFMCDIGNLAIPSEITRDVYLELQISDVCSDRSLNVFNEEDAPFFFGRERVVQKMIDSLRPCVCAHTVITKYEERISILF